MTGAVMDIYWSAEEQKTLKSLGLSPLSYSRTSLGKIVQRLKCGSSQYSIYTQTIGEQPPSASKNTVKKIKLAIDDGKLDWI